MNYTRLNPIGALASVCLLVVACGDNSGSSNDTSQSINLPQNSETVIPANQPPTISGMAFDQATVGQQWSFQPSISDPDGDSLIVSASNLPGWIELNDRTGQLSGIPGESDVQLWGEIVISVNDGQSITSLSPFTVNVMSQNAALGSATLSWLPPTEQTDGSPIGELSGYRLLYGQSSGDYTQTVAINNPGITRYMIEGLTSGEWYFAIQTVDGSGAISAPSAEARKTI